MAQLYHDSGVAKLNSLPSLLPQLLVPPVALTDLPRGPLPPAEKPTRKRAREAHRSDSDGDDSGGWADQLGEGGSDEEPAAGGGAPDGAAAAADSRTTCARCGVTLPRAGAPCEDCDTSDLLFSLDGDGGAAAASDDVSEPDGAGGDDSDPPVVLPPGLTPAQKIVIFGHHRDVLDGVESAVRSLGYQCIRYGICGVNCGQGECECRTWCRIDGGTASRRQQAYVARFQTEEECQVAIVGITAAGTGITLTAATTCVFVELYWNPGTLNQAEDRIHRIGQLASSVQVRAQVSTHVATHTRA